MPWTPNWYSSRAMTEVIPRPAAEFSAFAIIKACGYLSTSLGNTTLTAFLPIAPTISPMKIILMMVHLNVSLMDQFVLDNKRKVVEATFLCVQLYFAYSTALVSRMTVTLI